MSDTSSKPPGGTPGDTPPTGEQRQALARAFQAQAMKRQDPLAANLGVISADLMGFAHALAATIQARLGKEPAAGEGHHGFIQYAEMYLKFVRQIDRLARIERQLSTPTKGEETRR